MAEALERAEERVKRWSGGVDVVFPQAELADKPVRDIRDGGDFTEIIAFLRIVWDKANRGGALSRQLKMVHNRNAAKRYLGITRSV